MATEKVKDGFRVKLKGGGLGKRLFKTQKAAQAQSRGKRKPGKAVTKKAKKGTTAAATTSKPPRVGRSYQGVRLTMLAIAPVTREVIGVSTGAQTVSGALTKLGEDVRSRPYLTHLGIVAADVAIDRSRMVGQAAALSRGSVTAWAPEVYIFARGVEDWQGGADVQQIHARAVIRQTGYNTLNNTWVPKNARTYRLIKHGGQALRIGANRIGLLKRLKRAVQDSILRPVGATF